MPVAPPNQLCMLTDYISPTQTVVPCPNQDVVYGFGILDLAREPVVVQVPDFGDRFWVYQLGDQRTDGFAEVGKMYGTKPGLYLSSVRIGTARRRRAFAACSAARRGSATSCRACSWTTRPKIAKRCCRCSTRSWPTRSVALTERRRRPIGKVRWLPQVAPRGGSKVASVEPETFFDSLASVLDDVPPLPGEEAALRSACASCSPGGERCRR